MAERFVRDHDPNYSKAIAKEVQRRGFAEVTLWVLEENRSARAFYETYGFRLDGGTRRYPRTNVPEVRYRIGLNRG